MRAQNLQLFLDKKKKIEWFFFKKQTNMNVNNDCLRSYRQLCCCVYLPPPSISNMSNADRNSASSSFVSSRVSPFSAIVYDIFKKSRSHYLRIVNKAIFGCETINRFNISKNGRSRKVLWPAVPYLFCYWLTSTNLNPEMMQLIKIETEETLNWI